jgi:hypothetical protein
MKKPKLTSRGATVAQRVGWASAFMVSSLPSKAIRIAGADWPMAQAILNELQDLGIHMHDPSPSNIRFR